MNISQLFCPSCGKPVDIALCRGCGQAMDEATQDSHNHAAAPISVCIHCGVIVIRNDDSSLRRADKSDVAGLPAPLVFGLLALIDALHDSSSKSN
jgi:hypothetical protein